MIFRELPTPCYVVDETLIEENLKVLKGVMERTGARILLAQKAFSMYALYPLIGEYLCGATASGLYEARLCAEEMVRPLAARGRKTENHIFSPAYREEDFGEILKYCDHIVFNSCRQAERFGPRAKAAGKSVGLRINPECSTQEGHAIYDPCAPGSRLGVTAECFEETWGRGAGSGMRCGGETHDSGGVDNVNRRAESVRQGGSKEPDGSVSPGESVKRGESETENESVGLSAAGRWEGRDGVGGKDRAEGNVRAEGSGDVKCSARTEGSEELSAGFLRQLDGLHFHTLCEQNSDDLEKTLDAVEEKFGKYLKSMKWINFGGGHHITRKDYDIPRLERCIRRMQEKYGLTVYLEPGEAVALNAGFLVTQVLEALYNGMNLAILDTSAACHMPDVLEMPYRPPLQGSGMPGEKAYTYRLGGPTCLAGDIIGEYSFDAPLKEGDRLVFEDMAIYSMVKNNTFNGMPLPAIALRGKDGGYSVIRKFGYEDFRGRLS